MPYAGGSGTESDPYQIETWEHLDSVRNNLDSYFILNNDIDSSTSGYDTYASSSANGGSGWDPIGAYSSDPFTGEFDGSGYVISDLYIDRGSTNEVGLFSYIESGANISYVGVENVDITGDYRVGGLVGYNDDSVSDCYSTGSVDGSGQDVGGLIGRNDGGSVSDSYSTASVSGGYAGGLIGRNLGSVEDSYSTGSVSGSYVGGLVGENYDSVSRCYSIGSVSGGGEVGGLVGQSVGGSVSDSFWDEDTSGQTSSAGGTGKTTSEMKDVATFTDTSTTGLNNPWDFVDNPNDDTSDNDYWDIDSGVNDGYPNLTAIQNYKLFSTSKQTLNSPQEFTETITGLKNGTTYKFKAVAEENGHKVENDIKTFLTDLVLNDSVNLTDTTQTKLTLTLLNQVNTTETTNHELIKTFAEAVSYSDSYNVFIALLLSDSVSASDSVVHELVNYFSDSVDVTEAEDFTYILNLLDSVDVSDDVKGLLKFTLADSIGAVDSYTAKEVISLYLSDSTGITDSEKTILEILESDSVDITESNFYELTFSYQDLIDVADSDKTTVIHRESDSVDYSDSYIYPVKVSLSDETGATDSLEFEYPSAVSILMDLMFQEEYDVNIDVDEEYDMEIKYRGD